MLVGALLRQPVEREARMPCSDLMRLLVVALFGAVLAPAAMAWGLQRTSGTGSTLMLTLEASKDEPAGWIIILRMHGFTPCKKAASPASLGKALHRDFRFVTMHRRQWLVKDGMVYATGVGVV